MDNLQTIFSRHLFRLKSTQMICMIIMMMIIVIVLMICQCSNHLGQLCLRPIHNSLPIFFFALCNSYFPSWVLFLCLDFASIRLSSFAPFRFAKHFFFWCLLQCTLQLASKQRGNRKNTFNWYRSCFSHLNIYSVFFLMFTLHFCNVVAIHLQ